MFLPLSDQPCFFSFASKKASVYELIRGCVEIKCFSFNVVLLCFETTLFYETRQCYVSLLVPNNDKTSEDM